MEPKVYRNQKGQVVGELKEGIFRKKVNSSRHRLRIFPAYGLDAHILDDLELSGAKEIRLKETDTKNIYSTTIENFRKHHIAKNLSHGLQVFLPLSKWSVESASQKKLI